MIDQRAKRQVLPRKQMPADQDTAGDGGHVQTDTHAPRAAVPTHSTDSEAGHLVPDTHITCASPDDPSSARNGHEPVDTQLPDADLALLHSLLGHFARQLWDTQKQRISAGNRVAAMERDGLTAHANPARAVVTEYEAIERGIDRQLTRLARQHFMADWIAEQRGIGLPGFARLLGVTGSLDRFATVSKLWKYLGLHVVDGHAPRREKGVPWTHTNCQGGHLLTCKEGCATDHHPNCTPDGVGTAYAPQGRVVCHQIGEAIVKVGGDGRWRRLYDEKKAYYETERADWTQARRHNAAMRFAVKCLLRDMWVEWRVRRPSTC